MITEGFESALSKVFAAGFAGLFISVGMVGKLGSAIEAASNQRILLATHIEEESTIMSLFTITSVQHHCGIRIDGAHLVDAKRGLSARQ